MFCMVVSSLMVLSALVYPLMISAGVAFHSWLDYLYFLSSLKLIVSIVKYPSQVYLKCTLITSQSLFTTLFPCVALPLLLMAQVYLNFKRKSTVGWNIWNVLLDFTGGALSVAQVRRDEWPPAVLADEANVDNTFTHIPHPSAASIACSCVCTRSSPWTGQG
jgi:cystinosin